MIAEELASVRQVTERLFSALRRRDAADVAACYDEDAVFSSPFIGDVRGADVEALWRAMFAATRDSTLSLHDRRSRPDDRTRRGDRHVLAHRLGQVGDQSIQFGAPYPGPARRLP